MLRTRSSLVFTAAVVLAAAIPAACSDGGTEPPEPVPTSITLNKTTVALDAIGATDQLSATVRDQNGNTMSGQTVTWASSNAAAATVGTTGLVTAAANGSATITASSGSLNATATVTVAQVAAACTKVSGDGQSGGVGQALAQDLVVQVNDRLGNAIAGASVSFAVSTDGGSVAPTSGSTAANGQLATTWTLGTVAGAHTVTATSGSGSAQFGATATADVAASVASVSGDAQTALVSSELPESLVVKVTDQYGNAVSGTDVVWSVTSGGGSVAPTNTTTDATGQAKTSWTLGSASGQQTAQAAATGLGGSPVQFTATGTSLQVSSVSPDTIVEAAPATISGSGFDATPANNTVTVDGMAATVTAATPTQLTITVPGYNCLPQRAVNIQVTVGGSSSNTVSHPLKPAVVVNLAVGEARVIENPADFCLQFEPNAAGGEAYLVGIGAAAESPASLMPVSMTGVTGQVPAPGFAPFAMPVAAPARSVQGTVDRQALAERQARLRAEQRLRAWEREHLDPAHDPSLRQGLAAAPFAAPQAVPSVGDTIAFHVPNADNTGGSGSTAGPCDSIPITTVVKAVGSAGIFVVDTNNPVTDSLTDVEILAYSDTFDLFIYARDTLHFGTPSDLDANQRVFVVLTVEVNKLGGGGLAGFVFSGDLYNPAVCATSDQGEIFYGHVPDPNNTAGTVARSKTAVKRQMPSLIAHEFTHNIQQSRRLIELGGVGLASWEAEGQATFAEEVVGHATLGNSAGQDYGATTAHNPPGDVWYNFIFDRLAYYYGFNGATRNANAPEECTLYGSSALSTPCLSGWFYGASWSFQRYLADRYGPTWSGGEAGFTKDWIDNNPSLSGVANVEALLGASIDTLFARWAAMHYVDGQVAGADASLLMSSWNLDDVLTGLHASAPLAPVARTFGSFSVSESIRGGSTAYSLFSDVAARPATAIRLRDGSDAVLSGAMRPVLWIVRTQ